ncbi:related to DNA mismatch repair protein PMS1 [Hanseniaspora guilliermondii]|uniref:Related to DNA mismatch repair protein PMS1 n=1 Tax=Hanseniaspora guilliermondii TaxID=56406 RepID=A0A1L0CNV5_9ASCO|nr:related to DNA mismatch repair protein PMS1 [Hanseniaspora guilliermondii]
MNNIKAISDDDIHSITSGQVITDVNSIIKELLENSIDANSKNIEITLKDYCLNGIEIKDDGHGIREDDFDTLCLKHYTSKIEKFDDINTNLMNLGFRGEALNSICFISKTVIMTCTNDEEGMGHELHYNHNGDLIKQEIIPMDKGTNIVIDDIFKNLPVRRLNFERNYRKTIFNKCIRLIQDYCIINYDINIKVWNVVDNKRKLVLSNIGQKSSNNEEMNLQQLLKNCSNIFGSSKMKGINEIRLKFTMPSKKSFVKEHNFEGGEITMEGLISQKSFGFGKTTKTDNQYIYINKRPLDYTKITNIINEEYKKYNHLQYPFFVLNFSIPITILDLNVTPDKRTVFVHNEHVFLEMLRECLAEFWDKDGMMLYDNTQNIENKRKLIDDDDGRLVRQKTTETAIQEECSDNDSYLDVYKEVNEDRIPTFDEVFNTSELSGSSNSFNARGTSTRVKKRASLQQFKYNEDSLLENRKTMKQFQSKITSFMNPSTKPINDENEDELIIDMDGERTVEKIITPKRVLRSPTKSTRHEYAKEVVDNESIKKLLKSNNEEIMPSQERKVTDLIDISTLEKKMTLNMKNLMIKPISERPKSKYKHMFSTNADIENNDLQEKLLTLTVSKQDFLKMKVIGQFNLGFILCTRKLDSGYDMFIIDQHASDEKYNFEQLFKNTVINVQPLIKAVPIELNPLDKILIKDNVDVFTKNGFKLRFEKNDNEDIYLETLPLSEKTQFTIDDFFEIMDLLRANDGSYKVGKDIRCSKVRSMFAMRACRMSIMIGRPLNVQVMKRIVGNLSLLDKPWNCPHGRPTIRHLMELRSYDSFNSDYVL